METTTETVRTPRRLARADDGRWLGGVAAGLGEYFDLSPAIYRIAFVALALAGGTGILLYVAAWLVIPDASSADGSLADRFLRDHAERPSRAVGLAVLAFVAILALSEARWWPTPGNLWLAGALGVAALIWWKASPRGAGGDPAPSADAAGEAPAHIRLRRRQPLFGLALGSLLAGAGVVALLDATGAWNPDWRLVLAAMVVLTGAFVAGGAAAGLRVAGVAGVGVVLLAALAVAFVVRVPVFGSWGDHTAHPRSAGAVASSYSHGIGDFTVDLSDVPFRRGETHVKAALGIGTLRVLVPRDVTVQVTGRASAGELRLLGHTDSGGSVRHDETRIGAAPRRVLVLDCRVGIGLLVVQRA
jgi:phage shock protein PspC (stress-responsive transcriptional regulator)